MNKLNKFGTGIRFSEQQMKELNYLIGIFGETRSEVVRRTITNYYEMVLARQKSEQKDNEWTEKCVKPQ
jgi:predicted DNA-binding protein